MRPVNKQNPNKKYPVYQDAKKDLTDQLGHYCSYCERILSSTLEVEHVKYKKGYPELEKEWENFLLACKNCNTTKGTTDVLLADYYWPHLDNPLEVLEYSDDGRVKVKELLDEESSRRAQNTIELTGLDKTPKDDPQLKDQRWLNRRETWKKAEDTKKDLIETENNPRMQKWILKDAIDTGFFSIWYTVFSGHLEMQQLLIQAFPGTAPQCFDKKGKAIERPS